MSDEISPDPVSLPPKGGSHTASIGEGGSHAISISGDGSQANPLNERGYPLAGGTLAQRRAIAIAELILCSSVPTQVLLQAILVGLGWKPVAADGGFSLSFVVTMSLLDTVLLITLMVVLTRAHGESLSALWLGRRVVWKEVLLGLALVPPIFLMVVIILNTVRLFAPVLHNVQTNPLEEMATGGLMNAAAFGVLGILAGGVREELQRAFMLRRFEHLGGGDVGVVVLSIAFGIGHWVQGWDAAITTGVLGAVWAMLYLRRRSSIAPIVSHAGFNSIEVLRIAIIGS